MIACRNGGRVGSCAWTLPFQDAGFFELGCTVVRLLILVFNIYVGLVCSSRICYDSVLETILYSSLLRASELPSVNDFQTTMVLGDLFPTHVTHVSNRILYR